MSKIYILRHANWDLVSNKIDPRSINTVKLVSSKVPNFNTVISSPAERAITSAVLLTGSQPIIDDRASTFDADKNQSEAISEIIRVKKCSAVEAIFSIPELDKILVTIGSQLVSLCEEAIEDLPKNQNILIISHDTTMVSALKILKGEDFKNANNSFREFEGFILDEKLNIELVRFVQE